MKLTANKGCCILGIAGSGKSTLCNKLQQELGEGKYAVCAPTHKAALLIGAVTVYNLFSIDTHTHTYLKSAVEKFKNSGVEYIFIVEISMINSKIWVPLNNQEGQQDAVKMCKCRQNLKQDHNSHLSSCNQSLTPETYAAMKKQWIDCATPDVAHYGLKSKI